MKLRILTVLLSVLHGVSLQAQFLSSPPQHIEFNTGRHNSNGCLESVGNVDDVWWLSSNFAGPYTQTAIKVPHIGSWAVQSPPCTYAFGWIGENYNCYGQPANHGCATNVTVDLYFRVQFTLPVNPILVLDWQVAADDRVMGIYVNNNLVFTPPAGNHNMFPFNFRWCTDWVPGPNTIIVHVRSAGVPGPNNWAGLQVVSWGPPPSMTTMGSATVCNNTSSTTYTVTQIPPGTTSYSWNFGNGAPVPPTWNATSSQPMRNPTFGSNSGVLNTYAFSSAGCIGASTLNINVITPPVGISSSTTSVCPCAPVVLTATGAATYNWSPPAVPSASATTNPITVNPCVSTNYIVTGWDVNGCKHVSSPLSISILPIPPTSIAAQPAVICSGVSNTLTASGASNYTWLPSPPGPSGNNTWVVNLPPASTLITVLGQGANGCTNTAVVTLTAGQTIPLTSSNAILCTDISSCTTVSASTSFTPVTWSWQPITGNQPSIVVCPTVTTNYIVTATSNVGCASSNTIAVTVQTCCPPPTAIFALPTSTYCNVNFTNLAQYASVTGTFSGQGVTFSSGQYNFNTSSSLPGGTYTVAFSYTTAPFGCSYILYQYITISGPPPLAVCAPTMVCFGSPGVSISGTLSIPLSPGNNYTWQPGNITGQTALVSPTSPQIYTVTATSIVNGTPCVSANTVSVEVNYTCCPQASLGIGLIGTNVLTAPGILSGPIMIDQDITIGGAGNFTFSTGDFIMATGVKITVQSGVNLVLSDAHLYSCSNFMWTGIEVLNGGNVTSAPGPNGLSTLIEDAEIAIDVNNIAAGHAIPLLNLDGVVFNRNYFGIFLHNSILPSIPVLVKSCVFTCRNLPASTLSWPGASLNFPDLRNTTLNPATSLGAPYILNPSYSFTSVTGALLKLPLQYPPHSHSQFGIYIRNINNIPGGLTTTGVDLTSWSAPTSNEFNLFDQHVSGIVIRDASMTTINNTFQNSIYGICDSISTLMNARLSLNPLSSANPNTNNRFWDCTYAVDGYNVYDFNIEKATIRNNPTRGFGIVLNSNRFSYRIRHNSFANIYSAVYINYGGAPYNVGASGFGIYADSLIISQNYFGADLVYYAPLPYPAGQNLGHAINVLGDNTVPWNVQTATNYIQSNIIDRAFYGIWVKNLLTFPLEVSNNNVRLDGITSSGTPFGILLSGSQGNVVRDNLINSNVLGGPSNGFCYFFDSNNSPTITCNTAEWNNYGFFFEGDNSPGTWLGNTMRGNWVGLTLGNTQMSVPINSAFLGPQGNAGMASGNQWLGNWGGGTWETAVDAPSDAVNTPLYINSGYPYQPMNNWGSNSIVSYNTPGNLIFTTAPSYTCPIIAYPPFPSVIQSRPSPGLVTSMHVKDLAVQPWDLEIFPNPSSGYFSIISMNETERLNLTLLDMTGKIIYAENLVTKNYQVSLNLSLEQGIYLVSIRGENNKKIHKKLIIAK